MDTKEQPYLRYDSRRDVFWFPLKSGEKIPDGMHYISGVAGRAVGWKGFYPMGVIGVRGYMGLFGKLVVADSAKGKINELKALRESLAARSITGAYADLFKMRPYPHQVEAIEYMVTYDRLALLLEQGLGKTFISLMALQILKASGRPHRALVVCPKIVFNSWLRETARATDLSIVPYIGTAADRRELRARIAAEKPDIVLTTFDMLIDRDSRTYSMQVYRDAWDSMTEEGRAAYVQRIASRADPAAVAVLSSGTAEACAETMKKLPPALQPQSILEAAYRASSNSSFFTSLDFDCLVVDEASRCLNHESARSKAIEDLALRASRVTLLSGTLCVGRPTDLFQPMRILDHSILNMNWTEFKRKYCIPSPTNKHVIAGYKNLDHLKLRTDPFILAKSRAECIDLPERIITQREYSIPVSMEQLYDAIVCGEVVSFNGHDMHVELPVVKIVKCMQILGGFINVNDITCEVCSRCPEILKCVKSGINPGSPRCINPEATGLEVITYSLEGNPKLDLLLEDLEDSRDEKVIVWAWYRRELEAIEAALKKHKIPYIKAGDRDCDARFEADPSCRVFLGQTAQGIGITLNSATCTIYYSHGTALEPRLQSMDRNHRIGQTKSVIVKDYLCAGTVEEAVVQLLEHKRDVRDFMQNTSCLRCYKYLEGKNTDCEYLQPSCEFYAQRKSAEQKRSLGLGSFGHFTKFYPYHKYGALDPFGPPPDLP